jgi:CheY-like chemotaxis protein
MNKFYIIDDEEIFNFLNTEVIHHIDATSKINEFTSALDAIDFLKESISSSDFELPDYIFLDVRMPEMNGFEFLDEIQKLPSDIFSKTKLFMLSSSLDERDVNKALSYSIVKGFLSKPLSEENLKSIISA